MTPEAMAELVEKLARDNAATIDAKLVRLIALPARLKEEIRARALARRQELLAEAQAAAALAKVAELQRSYDAEIEAAIRQGREGDA